MKRIVAVLTGLILAFTTFGLTGCGSQPTPEEEAEEAIIDAMERQPVDVLYDHVIDLGTFNELDFDTANAMSAIKYDGWTWRAIEKEDQGGCTVIGKALDNGHMVNARNMDLSISHHPAYVFKTDVEGMNKTIGVAYSSFTGESFDMIAANGIQTFYKKQLPFIATDSLNDKGLYVEVNMRTSEKNKDGSSKFGSSGTNPKADTRVCMPELPTYLTLYCDTVEDALKMVKEDLDIYSMSSELLDWPLCVYMADATGNYGVLEIVNNEIIFNEKAPGQANFYLNKKYQDIESYKAGFGKGGRLDVALQGREAAKTKEDMWNAIDKVTYYQTNDPDNCKFDFRSEEVGVNNSSVEGMPEDWTTEVVLDDKYKDALTDFCRAEGKKIMGMSREKQMDAGQYWESALTVLTDCNDKTIKIRFFEDDDRTVEMDFD